MSFVTVSIVFVFDLHQFYVVHLSFGVNPQRPTKGSTMQNINKNDNKTNKTREEAKIQLQMKSETRGSELVKW